MVKQDNLRGLIVSLVTPFNNDLSIDFFGLKNSVARLLNKGVQNFVVLDSFSEFEFLCYRDQKKLIFNAYREIKNKGVLIIGCFDTSTDEIIKKIRFAEKFADYCLINLPFSALTSEMDFIDFFDSVFTRTKSKIILCNDPFLFKKNIPIKGLNKIVGWERLIGIFDYSKNKQYFSTLCDYHQLVKVFQGVDSFVVDSLKYNSSGSVSCLANVYPELFLSIQQNKFGNSNLFSDNFLFSLEKQVTNFVDNVPLNKEVQFFKKILSLEGIIQPFFNDVLKPLTEKDLEKTELFLKKSVV